MKYKVIVFSEKTIIGKVEDRISSSDFSIVPVSGTVEFKNELEANTNYIVAALVDDEFAKSDVVDTLGDELGDLPLIILASQDNLEDTVEYSLNLDSGNFLENLTTISQGRISSLEDELAMINAFIDEAIPMLEQIEGLILDLEEDPTNEEVQNAYFRILHTIKGTSACVGLEGMAKFAHAYEDYFTEIRKGEVELNKDSTSVLLEATDKVKTVFNDIYHGSPEPKEDLFSSTEMFKGSKKVTGSIQDSKKSASSEKVQVKAKSVVEGEVKSVEVDDRITVTMDVLDKFMDLSGELTISRNSIVKKVSELMIKFENSKEFEALEESIHEMSKMMSMKSVLRPLKRIVRDVSKSLGKEVDLIINGEDLKVDNQIAKVLGNCLVHLVRNSVDHGIEVPDKREGGGKDRSGTIIIDCREEDESIKIAINDDGGGIDSNKIAQKAIEKGIVLEDEVARWPKSKVLGLIFESGFSTAEKVSEISGRGVGMDMVKKSVESIKGKIFIESEIGEGSVFSLDLPIPKSVLIINSLIIESSLQHYVISLDEIQEVMRISKKSEDLKVINNALFLKHQEELLPVVSLSEVLSLNEKVRHEQDDYRTIVILKNEEGVSFVIEVDEIHEFEEVVVKKSSKINCLPKCFSGASLLGNGNVALVIDVGQLAHSQHITARLAEDYGDTSKEEQSESLRFLSIDIDARPYLIPVEYVHRLEMVQEDQIEYVCDSMILNYDNCAVPIVSMKKQLLGHANRLVMLKYAKRIFALFVDDFREIIDVENVVFESDFNQDNILGVVYIDDKVNQVLNVSEILDPFVHKKIKSSEKENDDKIIANKAA